MRRILNGGLLFAMLLATGAWGAPPPAYRPVGNNPAAEQVSLALGDLRELESALRSGYDPNGVQREIGELRNRLHTLESMLNANPGPLPPPVVDGRPVMDGRQLGFVLERLAGTFDGGERLRIVSNLQHRYRFTVEQVRRIAGMFWYDRERVEVIRILADDVVDPQNCEHLYAVVRPESQPRVGQFFRH